jgi:hypothetical protein
MSLSRFVLVGLAAVCALALPSVSAAQGKPGGGGGHGGGGGGGGGSTQSPTGYDISYPQCGRSYPSNVLFGIVGVNDGIVYSPNPCLGTGDGPSELAWAEQYDGQDGAILYANTADPGPALSSHWPDGQASPQPCNTIDNPGLDTPECSYDYGWNAAADSYGNAVDAYVQLGAIPGGATQTPQPNQWWLDVETGNSWEASSTNNVADLQGAVAYFESQGVRSIGIYASATDWQTITGGSTAFSSLLYWQPGSRRQSTAQSYCGGTGVTGGPVTYSQYSSGGYDADVRC